MCTRPAIESSYLLMSTPNRSRTCPRSPICFSTIVFSSMDLKGHTTCEPTLASSLTTYLPTRPVQPNTVAVTPLMDERPPGPAWMALFARASWEYWRAWLRGSVGAKAEGVRAGNGPQPAAPAARYQGH